METLLEVTRSQMLAQSRGNARHKRKNKSSILGTANVYNDLDTEKLFAEDIIECNIPVRGETDDYIVTMSYIGVVEELKNQVRLSNNELNLRCCVQAVQQAFNRNDVYVHCTCPDFAYRFNYWSTIKGYEAKNPETRAANITNPANDKGVGCKHVLLVLSRTLWILKSASVIHNYLKYLKRTPSLKWYYDIIAELIFEEVPQDDDTAVQTSMFDDEPTEEETPTEEPVVEEEPVQQEVEDDKKA